MSLVYLSLRMEQSGRSWVRLVLPWPSLLPLLPLPPLLLPWGNQVSGGACGTGSYVARKPSSSLPTRPWRNSRSKYVLLTWVCFVKDSFIDVLNSFFFVYLQIMHAFSVAPFDQNLSIDGRSLTDDSATLGSLGVFPESIICLKVGLCLWFLAND